VINSQKAVRLTTAITLLLLVSGCSPLYRFGFIDKESAKGIPADSLRWNYIDGKLVDLPVLDSKGNVVRLAVDRNTYLHVRTTENDEYYMEMLSVMIEDKGDGLLGSNTIWRGYDARQGALRSVLVREVVKAEVHSRHPAYRRILRNNAAQ
jgi:hypothetical protein